MYRTPKCECGRQASRRNMTDTAFICRTCWYEKDVLTYGSLDVAIEQQISFLFWRLIDLEGQVAALKAKDEPVVFLNCATSPTADTLSPGGMIYQQDGVMMYKPPDGKEGRPFYFFFGEVDDKNDE